MAYRGLTIIFASFLIFLGQFGYSNGTCQDGECSVAGLGLSQYLRPDPDKTCYSNAEEVDYICEEHTTLQGQGTNTCGEGGSWQNTETTTCEYCTAPEDENLIPTPNQMTYGVGETVQFSCNEGYKLTPSTWSPTQLAECRATGNLEPATNELGCMAVSCPAPTDTNKDLTWTDKGQRETYHWNETITYSCSEGFKVEGSPDNACINDGEWKNEDPTCIFAFNCSAPSNTQVNLTWTDKGQRETYYGNETITYSCPNGLKVDGFRDNMCTAQDNWKSDHPTCKSSGNVVQVIWYSLMMTTCYSLFSFYM